MPVIARVPNFHNTLYLYVEELSAEPFHEKSKMAAQHYKYVHTYVQSPSFEPIFGPNSFGWTPPLLTHWCKIYLDQVLYPIQNPSLPVCPSTYVDQNLERLREFLVFLQIYINYVAVTISFGTVKLSCADTDPNFNQALRCQPIITIFIHK